VTLSCSAGLPSGEQCSFSPSTPVTPANSAVDVVMSISTTTSHADVLQHAGGSLIYYLAAMLLPGIVISVGASRRKAKSALRPFIVIGTMLLLIILMACAGVSSGGGGGPPPPNPKTYHVTVTGTSPGTLPDAGQSVVVTLVVN
jgi:hypothetical protein